MTHKPIVERQVFLLIADISGYTRFMVARSMQKLHGQYIISRLMQAVLDEVSMPLTVAKVEGDAVFLYAETGDPAETGRIIGERMPAFMNAFRREVEILKASDLCPCAACSNIDSLDIKIVAHFGLALFYRIAGFTELSGVDVILVHRLLKNSLTEDRYILLTDAARQFIPMPESTAVWEEVCGEFGCIPLHVHRPGKEDAPTPARKRRLLVYRLWFEVKKAGWTLLRLIEGTPKGNPSAVAFGRKTVREDR